MSDLNCSHISNDSNIGYTLQCLKYESADEADPDQEFYKISEQLKCGEIVLNNKCSISFSCSFCDANIYTLEKYLKHIIKNHLLLTNQEASSILSDVKENECATSVIKIERVCDFTAEQSSDENREFIDINFSRRSLKESAKSYRHHSQPTEIDSNINEETLMHDTALETDQESTNDTKYEDIELLDELLEDEEALTNERVMHYDNIKFEIEVLPDKNMENESNELPNGTDVRCLSPKSKVKTSTQRKANSGEFICTQCPKNFKTKLLLNVHTKRHKLDKPYSCVYCDSRFADSSNLKVHVNRHLGIKPHSCVLCEKSFISTTELKLHMRSHTGEKPYVCEECGRKFSSSGHLKSHRRRHYNDRPYECETCGKDFFDRRLLRDHEAAHSSERPFECDVCNATFKRQKALSEHKKLHSGVRNYKCKICSKTFAQNAGLWSHMKQHHTTG